MAKIQIKFEKLTPLFLVITLLSKEKILDMI